MQAPPSRILRSRWEGFACCLIIRNIMKKSINEISDEEFVQQLIVKLDNLLAEADSVYNSPPPLPGKEERCMKVIYPGQRILLMIMVASWCAKHPNVLQKQ